MESLRVLEEKVAGAVDLIAKLRAENVTMAERLKKSENESKRLQHDLEKTRTAMDALAKNDEEVKTLRSERKTLKTRVESILQKLSVLDAEE